MASEMNEFDAAASKAWKNQAGAGIRTLTSTMPVQASVLFRYFPMAPHPHDPASILIC